MKQNTKKTSGKKSAALRIPKGLPSELGKAGQFVNRDKWELFIKPAIEEKRREERRKTDREQKRAARAARKAIMVDRAQVRRDHPEFSGDIWGNTSTDKLHAKTAYRWHGAFIIRGGEDAVKRAGQLAGSDMQVKKLRTGSDAKYEITVTPFFGKYRPGDAVEHIPDHMADMQRQLETSGATVTPLGAFWRD